MVFELELLQVYDVSFLGRILQCMPTLRQFTVTVAAIHKLYLIIVATLSGGHALAHEREQKAKVSGIQEFK